MRLIDADVLVRDINADPYRTESEKSYDRCLVHRQPTVDAVEVIHASWVDVRDYCGDYMCSNCKELSRTKTYNYCPNCGAKMDGGVSDG